MSIPLIQNLLLSNSKSMNVDGTTPKTFIYTAPQALAILGISCILKDEGNTSLNKFGAITALTNGILIQATIGGITSTIMTIKDNSDLCKIFEVNQFGNSAALSILGIVTPEGFGASNNIFVGNTEFKNPFTLILNQDDTIQAVVQDNLTNIDILEMTVKLWLG